MTRPLHDGVRKLVVAARHEEWTMHRALTAEQRADAGTDSEPGAPVIFAGAIAGRISATQMLQQVLAGAGEVDDCADPEPIPLRAWDELHHAAHEATTALLDALGEVDEEQLASNPGPVRSHPQYLWRNVVIGAARGPMLSYAEWHHRSGRSYEAIGVLSRWYEAVRGASLPTKARSDASYDLACGLARAGRLDEAMQFLPDAFAYNDRAAVPVLKAWARQDTDLAPLAGRADFAAVVGT